jgi:hypothetical protein
MAILKQFGLEHRFRAQEAVGGTHQVWNLLSLQRDLRQRFDDLELWFEGHNEVRHSDALR